MEDLKLKKINACGTVNSSRKDLPSFSSSKTVKRGDYESFTSNSGTAAIKWIDKKEVFILTNFHVPQETCEVQRRDKDGSRKIYPCPASVTDYSANMNSVDRFDQLMTNYKLDRRSRKWWHRIFFYFRDAAVVNSYVLYKTSNNKITLKPFKIQCVEGFLAARQTQRKRPSTVVSSLQIENSKPTVSIEMRRKESGHQPERTTRRRCAICSTKAKEVCTVWACSVCKVPLYLGKKCFQKYHT